MTILSISKSNFDIELSSIITLSDCSVTKCAIRENMKESVPNIGIRVPVPHLTVSPRNVRL